MDLQDFDSDSLYFDDPLTPEVEALLVAASDHYSEGKAEESLLAAQVLAPDNLMVYVGLYRFYYYQHRYADAVEIACRVMSTLAAKLALPNDWQILTEAHLPVAAARSISLLRFYLLALKGCGYLNLRLGQFEEGKRMLNKVMLLDAEDRLGAKVLLNVLAKNNAEILSFPNMATAEMRP